MAEEIRPGARAEEDKPRTRRGGTRTVRMIEGISGGRHDGQDWPAAGGTIDVPAWEADELVASRHAVFEGDEPEVHSAETVPGTPPPGHVATGRVARGEATAEEVMTGHPADFAAEERAAEEQHGARGDEEFRGARHLHPDPRPDSQILAEDFTDEERQRIELGEVAAEKAKDAPAGERRKDRKEGRRAEAARRAAERNSALRYAVEGGVAGAPGAEVPGLAPGAEPVPFGEGVRPAAQVEAEAPVRTPEGEDVTEPGLEGMSEEERVEYETRMPGYTAPEEVRDEPVPGQPTLDAPDPGQRFEGAGAGTAGTPEGQAGAAAGNAGEEGTARDGAGAEAVTGEAAGETGRHRVTAESDTPIEVSGDSPEGEQAGEPDAAGEPVAEGERDPDAPAPSAAKQAWVDYAVSRGADVHAASNMTKADLMSRYGGRL